MNLALSARNRSASIRIPMYSKSPKAKRLEFRCPDPSCNGYLAWSAMLMAMLDGIQNKIDPGEPLDRDIYEMTREEMKPGDPHDARVARGSDQRARSRTTTFLTARRRLHRGSRRDMDRLQAREGARSDPAAAASARVLSVLRQLKSALTQVVARAGTGAAGLGMRAWVSKF